MKKKSWTKSGGKWFKIVVTWKFDLDPKEILDESLLFDLKKTSEEKIFDSILEKIPDKNDIF